VEKMTEERLTDLKFSGDLPDGDARLLDGMDGAGALEI